jgi:hypothetical protein
MIWINLTEDESINKGSLANLLIAKPVNKPALMAFSISLLSASITITKSDGDNGSPCRMPREL